jgi:hypothetical protein
MTGHIVLHSNPTANMHAATKQYVDSVAGSGQPPFTITSGTNTSVGYSHIIGEFDESKNYFDVFPPSGKTMAKLVAFIPSIAFIAFNGDVDLNDYLRCEYRVLTDRIRVLVQNTEQREKPAANWLAIWS